MNAGMAYLARNPLVRYDPRRRFPWFAGALLLAAPYAFAEPPKPAGGLRLGRVARYAWVRDYHEWMAVELRRLEEECALLGGTCKGYVDHGPIAERAFAEAAGAGWIGRNGLYLTPAAGSYQYLAVLLTSWPAPPTRPHPNRCGSCRACLTNCPTGAIGAQGVDARLCLSYWNIEYRGLLPLRLWRPMGDRLFGCDDCQTVCPWNRKPNGAFAGMQADAELAWPDLREILSLSGRAFEKKYAHTAFLRTGRAAMARNALVVISNSDCRALQEVLPEALDDASPLVRTTAAAAAWRCGQKVHFASTLKALPEREQRYLQRASVFFG